MADCQQVDILSAVDEFRVKASQMAESSARNYLKAIKNLEIFLRSACREASLSQSMLAEWLMKMWLQGLSVKTIAHYFDIIAALFKETARESDEEQTEVFHKIKARLKEIKAIDPGKPALEKLLQSFLNITKSASYVDGSHSTAADLLTLSIANEAMPLLTVAKLKTADKEWEFAELEALVKRNSSPRRQYIFNLNQPSLTPRQLEAKVTGLVSECLHNNNISPLGTIDETIKSIWAYSALRCGFSAAEVAGVFDTAPAAIPMLSLCKKSDVSEARRAEISHTVADLFLYNPLRWYAMKLRRRVSYESMKERIARTEGTHMPEFFYPHEEIAKKIGKKLVFGKKPVIRDIVFFRSRVTDILPLFSKIGDIAWCYTTSGRPGGDYAAIPQNSFILFQRTISHFTCDYEIAPIGGFAPREGEKVIVLDGLMANQEFDVEKVSEKEDTIYQLHMIGTNGIQWRTRATRPRLHPPLR